MQTKKQKQEKALAKLKEELRKEEERNQVRPFRLTYRMAMIQQQIINLKRKGIE